MSLLMIGLKNVTTIIGTLAEIDGNFATITVTLGEMAPADIRIQINGSWETRWIGDKVGVNYTQKALKDGSTRNWGGNLYYIGI